MNSIGIISTNDSEHIGGSEELWLRSAAALRQRGARVAVSLSPRVRGAHALTRLEQSADSVEFRESPNSAGWAGRALRRFRAPEWERWIARTRPEFVLISQGDYQQDWRAARACRRARVPYALLIQAATDHFGPDPAAWEELRAAYAGAVAVYFVSRANHRSTERRLALSLPGAKVVRNPFNVPHTAAPPWPAEGPWRMACVARLDAFAKGMDLLFECLRAPAWRERDLDIHLYGSGPHRVALTELKTRWGLDRVHFAGETADVEGVWRDNHCLVLPSRQEGLPLALVEAALCARPALVTDVAGNAEVVEDNVTGFIARAPAPAPLGEALERAWRRRGDWRAMGLAAAQRIRNEVPADPGAEFATELAGAAGLGPARSDG